MSNLSCHPRPCTLVAAVVTFLLVVAGCGRTDPPPDTGITVPAGYRAEAVFSDLRGPTQMISGPNDELWVAQLAGGENAGTGEVVALSFANGERRVVLDGIFKPTGIALLGDALWIAAGRDLLRAPVVGAVVGTPAVVRKDLPFNGRSNGTLTVSPARTLVFETSGSRAGNQPSAGSATLWDLDPADPANPRPRATGLKGAYAHAFDQHNRLWITEIGDDTVNGTAPPDELNLIIDGADYGWPQCFGEQQAARNYNGDAAMCQRTRAPVALFPANATPTSVAVSPWEPDTLLVALWNTGRIVRVRVTAGDTATGVVEPWLTGLDRPQHLLALPDGSLLVSDFDRGTIYRMTRDTTN